MKNNLRTLLVSINDSPEDIGSILINCPDVEVCKLSPSQTRVQFFERVSTYLKNCTNRLECGQDIVIVFYNTKNYVEALAENIIIEKNVTQNVAHAMAITELRDIFNMSRNSQNGSLTLIMFEALPELQDMSNCLINLCFEPYNATNLYFDIKTSNTKNIEHILSKAELEKLKQLLDMYGQDVDKIAKQL